MRLINTQSLDLEEFFNEDIPPYAILSHTWGKEEVTLQDYLLVRDYEKYEDERDAKLTRKRNAIIGREGFGKITECIAQTAKDDLGYLWIDTCCIDKTSSAEMSEAINSMYQWYASSAVCYAYLADVEEKPSGTKLMRELRRSRWFTRGWTLQELLAPEVIVFFNRSWQKIGQKKSGGSKGRGLLRLEYIISLITGIRKVVLTSRYAELMQQVSVAERFSWAAGRQTTRKEDMAYCLLGIFELHMPLLYGEGDRAFYRLQEEIMRRSDDTSLLAWGLDCPVPEKQSILALGAGHFKTFTGDVLRSLRRRHGTPITMTNQGLEMTTVVVPASLRFRGPDSRTYSVGKTYYAVLPCGFSSPTATYLATAFVPCAWEDGDVGGAEKKLQVWRAQGSSTIRVTQRDAAEERTILIRLRDNWPMTMHQFALRDQRIRATKSLGVGARLQLQPSLPTSLKTGVGVQLLEVFPPGRWNPESKTLHFLEWSFHPMRGYGQWDASTRLGMFESKEQEPDENAGNGWESTYLWDAVFLRFQLTPAKWHIDYCLVIRMRSTPEPEGKMQDVTFEVNYHMYQHDGNHSLADLFIRYRDDDFREVMGLLPQDEDRLMEAEVRPATQSGEYWLNFVQTETDLPFDTKPPKRLTLPGLRSGSSFPKLEGLTGPS
jgi:hypothetical protein